MIIEVADIHDIKCGDVITISDMTTGYHINTVTGTVSMIEEFTWIGEWRIHFNGMIINDSPHTGGYVVVINKTGLLNVIITKVNPMPSIALSDYIMNEGDDNE